MRKRMLRTLALLAPVALLMLALLGIPNATPAAAAPAMQSPTATATPPTPAETCAPSWVTPDRTPFETASIQPFYTSVVSPLIHLKLEVLEPTGFISYRGVYSHNGTPETWLNQVVVDGGWFEVVNGRCVTHNTFTEYTFRPKRSPNDKGVPAPGGVKIPAGHLFVGSGAGVIDSYVDDLGNRVGVRYFHGAPTGYAPFALGGSPLPPAGPLVVPAAP